MFWPIYRSLRYFRNNIIDLNLDAYACARLIL